MFHIFKALQRGQHRHLVIQGDGQTDWLNKFLRPLHKQCLS
jgi:hypothetical protein